RRQRSGATSQQVALFFDRRRDRGRRPLPVVVIEPFGERVQPLPEAHGPAVGVERLEDEAGSFTPYEGLPARELGLLGQTNDLAAPLSEDLGPDRRRDLVVRQRVARGSGTRFRRSCHGRGYYRRATPRARFGSCRRQPRTRTERRLATPSPARLTAPA